MDVLDLVNDSNHVGPGHDFMVRPFVCKFDHCDRAFARKSDLARHFRIHTNERPFICVYRGCGKAFIQRSALTVHTRVHTGERPHHCETCNKAFADSSSLARHRRIHTGKRPYGCKVPGCGRQFARRNTYLKHFKRQHPDLPPPTSSSVRALHIPAFRTPTQSFLAGGSVPASGSDTQEYGTSPSTTGHPHSFAASHPPEGAAYYNGGFVNGQLHSSQLAPSNGLRPYFHNTHAEAQGHSPQGALAHAGAGSEQAGQAGQGDRHELNHIYDDPSGQSHIGLAGPEYTNGDQQVFSYQDNSISRVPSNGMMNNNMIYFKQDSNQMRQFTNDPNHMPVQMPQAPWGGVGGGFAPGQLALPPMNQSLQPSYYPNGLQSMNPQVKMEGNKLQGQRQSPLSEHAASPEPLVEIGSVPAIKFQQSTAYNMPFTALEQQHMASSGMNMSGLGTANGQPLHSAPPHMQRFHSAPGVPSVSHGWNQLNGQLTRAPLPRRASAQSDHWDEVEGSLLKQSPETAHASPINAKDQCIQPKVEWSTNGTTYPMPGGRPCQFRFSSTASTASTASSLLNVTQTPQSLPPMNMFPGGQMNPQQPYYNGQHQHQQQNGQQWINFDKSPNMVSPSILGRPVFAPPHSNEEATPDEQHITLSSKIQSGGITRDRQASGISSVGLGIANVTFEDPNASDNDGGKEWTPSDDGSAEGEDEIESEDDDAGGDNDSDDDFVLNAKPKRKATGSGAGRGRAITRGGSRTAGSAPKTRRIAA